MLTSIGYNKVFCNRPGAQAPKRGSLPGTSSRSFFQPMDNQEMLEKEFEMEKVHSQVSLVVAKSNQFTHREKIVFGPNSRLTTSSVEPN